MTSPFKRDLSDAARERLHKLAEARGCTPEEAVESLLLSNYTTFQLPPEADPDGFIPFAKPELALEEVEEVLDTMTSGWLTTAGKVRRFETEFAQYVGAEHALAVNSATAGLHLALEAIGIGPGDQVITTDYTFTSSAEVIRYLGADPIFVDIDPETLNMDVALVEKALKEHTRVRALMPVHIAGQPCDMDPLLALAREHNLKIVEDAAHALPTEYKNRRIGGFGDLTVFSFYVTKTITTGEGGMVTTADPEYAKRIKTMRLHGISKDVFDRYTSKKPSWYYEVIAPGFKYNMPDLSGAIGIHQLAKADRFHKRRQAIAERYHAAFADLPLTLPATAAYTTTHAWHLYIVRLKPDELSCSRDRFIERLAELGVGASVHFIPMHLQPYWRDHYDLKPEQFPLAHQAASLILSLPIYTKMSDAEVARVIECVRQVCQEFKR